MEIPRTPGKQPSLSIDQYREVLTLKEARRTYLQDITYAQLARKWGIPVGTVINAARKGVKRYDYAMWKERQDRKYGNAVTNSI